jgi:hypothetical protein
VKKVGNTGAVEFRGIRIRIRIRIGIGIGRASAGRRVCVMVAGPSVKIFDLTGALIIEHPWPKPGIKYVSNGRSRGPRPKTESVSEMS